MDHETHATRGAATMSDTSAPAIARAIEMLEHLAAEGVPLTVSELARHAGIPKSSASRILSELHHRHWVTREGKGKYCLGSRLFAMASSSVPWEVMDRARQVLPELHAASGETSVLGILEAFEVLYLAQCESKTAMLRASASPWRRYPAHSTAVGKVLLASLSPARWEQYCAEVPLERLTGKTIVDTELMRKELARVREQGFAIDAGEKEDGLWCVGAPIESDGRTIAGIGLSVPAARVGGRADEFKRLVCEAARHVTSGSGYVWSAREQDGTVREAPARIGAPS